MNDEKAKNIICSSVIFKGFWGNPHPQAKNFEPPKRGGGKGSSFFEMYKEIAAELPEVKSMLNIGVGPGQNMSNETIRWLDIYDMLFGPMDRFVNVDLFPKAIDSIKTALKNKTIHGRAVDYFSEFHVSDVRKIDELDIGVFDLTLWSHGPEHVYRKEWKDTFDKLDKLTKVMVIHLPWGSGYNDEPTHFSPSVRRGELEEFGFNIRYVGVEDTKQACMYGWKRTGL